MSLLHLHRLGPGPGFVPRLSHALSCQGIGFPMLYDRRRIILSHNTADLSLETYGHSVRLREVGLRHPLKLRAKPSQKFTFRVLINNLLRWRINAESIYPCHPGLHLELAVVNPRFVIQKVPGQKHRRSSPVQPEMI